MAFILARDQPLDHRSCLRACDGCCAVQLQQEKDPEEWGIDVPHLQDTMRKAGIEFVRAEVVDFDPHSLRKMLPHAAHVIATQLAQQRRVYVHCTAGLGRAPAACIAYLYWFQQMGLDGAYQHVTKIRPCGPKRESVRGATFDMLDGRGWDEFYELPEDAWSELDTEQYKEIQHRLISSEQLRAQPQLSRR